MAQDEQMRQPRGRPSRIGILGEHPRGVVVADRRPDQGNESLPPVGGVPDVEERAHQLLERGSAGVFRPGRGGVDEPRPLVFPPEQAAVEYAYSKGVVFVAASGHGSESPSSPWSYADYPAAAKGRPAPPLARERDWSAR